MDVSYIFPSKSVCVCLCTIYIYTSVVILDYWRVLGCTSWLATGFQITRDRACLARCNILYICVYIYIYINYRYTQHIYIIYINYRYTHTQLLTHGHPGDGIWAIPTILNHAYEPLSGKDGFPLMNCCLRANPQCIE